METVIVMTSETLGRDDDDLGRRLMVKFLQQLAAMPDKPHVVAFYNGGVKLLGQSSTLLEALAALEAAGTELVACGTCVDHFGLRGRLALGRVSDMREIVSTMTAADKVITV